MVKAPEGPLHLEYLGRPFLLKRFQGAQEPVEVIPRTRVPLDQVVGEAGVAVQLVDGLEVDADGGRPLAQEGKEGAEAAPQLLQRPDGEDAVPLVEIERRIGRFTTAFAQAKRLNSS